MSGAAKNYQFGTKAQWRRTIWNAISRRMASRKRDAVVLYLAGAEALDHPHALRKGFAEKNLISCEIDRAALRAQRSKGLLAINADFTATIRDWPQDVSVRVVFGDFCHGLEPKVLDELSMALSNPAFYGAVIAINLMRGRDPNGNSLREFAAKFAQSDLERKHRGFLYLMSLCHHMFLVCRDHAPNSVSDRDVAENLAMMLDPFPFQYFSYKSSGGVIFDSIVGPNPWTVLMAHLTLDEVGRWHATYDDRIRKKTTTRLIAPILAHRTMWDDRRVRG